VQPVKIRRINGQGESGREVYSYPGTKRTKHANVFIPNGHPLLAYWTERTKDLPELEFEWADNGLWICREIFFGGGHANTNG
jgi:hypothetical protein